MAYQSEVEEFGNLQKALEEGGVEGADLAAAESPQLCELYNKVKGPLALVLPLIERIPIYGKMIADAIRLLMRIADSLCPA